MKISSQLYYKESFSMGKEWSFSFKKLSIGSSFLVHLFISILVLRETIVYSQFMIGPVTFGALEKRDAKDHLRNLTHFSQSIKQRAVWQFNCIGIVDHHLKAIFMGVVRQEVNTSAGNSALCGSVSWASQAASKMQSLTEAAELDVLQSWSWNQKRYSLKSNY